jgi:anaerobic magnesium-protoporphyrin IX monomethyl ester cyclase
MGAGYTRAVRVLLSTPPARYWQTTNFILTNFPPLALASVAAAVSPPHEVRIVENSRFRIRAHDLFREVRDFGADVVAFTNNFYPDSLIIQQVSRQLKAAFPGLRTIVGGQAPTFLPEEYIANGIDYVVLYEGEHTFRELIQHLAGEGDKDVGEIDGIVWRDVDGRAVVNDRRSLIQDFDDLPMPRRDLLPHYPSITAPGYPATAIETVRGCPYRCRFCTRPTFWGKHREYSNERILEELALIKRQGFREVMFTDDMMATNHDKMYALCEEMLRRDLTISFGGALRADTASKRPDLIEIMRKAGLFFVNVGFESYSRKALKDMNKAATLDINRQASETLRESGVLILGSHVYGAPGQTDEDLALITRDGMEHCDFFRMNMYTPQVGSPLYYEMKKQGRMPDRSPEDFNQFEYLFDDGRDPEAMKRGFVTRQLQYYMHPKILGHALTGRDAKAWVMRRAYIAAAMFVGYRQLRKVGIEIM